MKRLFLGLFLLITTLAAAAGDYKYLAIETSDGTVRTVSVEQLKVTFSDGCLVASSADGQTQVTLTDLKKMYFTNDAATAIGTITADEATSLIADGAVYNLQGMRISNPSAMPKGTYIIVKNGQPKKVQLK